MFNHLLHKSCVRVVWTIELYDTPYFICEATIRPSFIYIFGSFPYISLGCVWITYNLDH